MGKAQLLLLAFATITAISLYNLYDNMEPHQDTMFSVWADIHSKKYTVAEKQYRKGVWMSNYKYVQEHNARFEAGKETYNLEMNLFADLTNEEFAAIYLMTNPTGGQGVQLQDTKKCTGPQAPTTNLPASVDWSAKGAVTPIKNQGQCGSCWAFSTTGSLEGASFKINGLTSYSEQQLVDCSHSYGNNGCNGGLMNMSFWYVIDHGITTESKYPYRGVGGSCHYNQTTDSSLKISGCTQVTVDKEIALQGAVAQQPVSVAIEANHLSFQLYKSGVYSGNCGTKLDHGVLTVGYGQIDGKKHWKVKNSWGATWGSQGYIYIARQGDGKGKCGIQMAASFPIV